MHTEYHKWFSYNLGRDMELKVYGHYGQAYIVFPSSKGHYNDYECMGMVDKISSFIDGGKIKLFTIGSVDEESLYNQAISPAERNARQDAYYKYVTDEVVPFIKNHCNAPEKRLMATGVSMGAYHSVNFFLRNPEVCGGTIALSGLYRLDRGEFKLSANDIQDLYYNSPIHYLPHVVDHEKLELYRRSTIIICTGQGAWEEEAVADTRDLEYSLRNKGVTAWIDYWGDDVYHDWFWWFIQMNHFLGKLY